MTSVPPPSLVIGASGLVGREILRRLQGAGSSVVGTCWSHPASDLARLDLTDHGAVRELLERVAPETVFCPAAQPNVDFVERNPRVGWEVNVAGLRCLCEILSGRSRGRLVYFSSDYVFDGRSGPYGEDAAICPISEYGRQKVAGERLIQELLPSRSMIVRTTVVYGWEKNRKNFAVRLIDELRAGKRVRVPVDQTGTPTFCPNLADAVLELASLGFTGLINVVGPDLMDRFTFAKAVASAFALDPSGIEGVTTSQLGQPAARPLRGGLKIELARSILQETHMLPVREALGRMRESEGQGA